MSSLAAYWRWQCELAKYEEEEVPTYVGQGEAKDFEACPEGLHQAVCVDVIDKGIVDGKFGKKHKLVLVWQPLPTDEDGNDLVRKDGKRFQVQKWYTASMHKKSNLHRDLQIWRGRKYTKEEMEMIVAGRFDIDNVIGANCQLTIIHSAPNEDGDRYANVFSIVPYKGKDKAAPLNYVRFKDRPENGNGVESHEDEDEEALPF